ncbi:MAG: hypothetical protein FWC95_04620 [Defluviitaleaceae bacterium]|nr:hypothetical protein [Defluviitaleaceae bacterium]
MLKDYSLRGFMLHEFPLEWNDHHVLRVMATESGWLDAHRAPGTGLGAAADVHTVLIREGIIKDPILRNNYKDIEWIEKRSWWYKTTFNAPELNEFTNKFDKATLHLDGLDVWADIYLNGAKIGVHKSQFYPFEMNIRDLIKKEGNILLIRLTTGLDRVKDEETGTHAYSVPTVFEKRDDTRRLMLRKAQFGFGWDWSPRASSCGIMGNCFIAWEKSHKINHLKVWTKKINVDGSAEIGVTAEVELIHPWKTAEGTAKLIIQPQNTKDIITHHETCSVYLLSGINYIDYSFTVQNASLWWPAGHGEQPLYTAQLFVDSKNISVGATQTFGIRTIKLDTSAQEAGRKFGFVINGKPIFAKGANWVPADTVYGRVSDARYTTLIQEAKAANFNMLRVWGGGLYEPDIFYDTCDAEGILVWQDFMFSCGIYPEQHEWLNLEIEKEMDYQTRRLASHASLALWCGNNENHWGAEGWYPADFYNNCREDGLGFANIMAPQIIRKNSPHTLYWNSSPYGGDLPNGHDHGDTHHWFECFQSKIVENRITPERFDSLDAKFVSEYGVLGPCTMSEIKKFYDGDLPQMFDEIWHGHTNRNDWDKNAERDPRNGTVLAGIHKHYKNIACDDLENYVLLGGLFQGLMYQYSLESIRFNHNCGGALFWMYNDAWGELGWTIIDSGLHRKPSFYFTQRAFAPVKFILREENGNVLVYAENSTGKDITVQARFGFKELNGGSSLRVDAISEQTFPVVLPAFSRIICGTFDIPNIPADKTMIYLQAESADFSGHIPTAFLRRLTTKDLALPVPNLQVLSTERDGDKLRIRIKASTYAHAVHIPEAGDTAKFDDYYFDMLPGEERTITWQNTPTNIGTITVAAFTK